MGTLDLTLLSAMITPAVLISACSTLIFSTSTRLARIVDRVRGLTRLMESLFSGETRDFVDERRRLARLLATTVAKIAAREVSPGFCAPDAQQPNS